MPLCMKLRRVSDISHTEVSHSRIQHLEPPPLFQTVCPNLMLKNIYRKLTMSLIINMEVSIVFERSLNNPLQLSTFQYNNIYLRKIPNCWISVSFIEFPAGRLCIQYNAHLWKRTRKGHYISRTHGCWEGLGTQNMG